MPVLLWVVVGALPWWSTTQGSAAVWSASTVATAALALAALVSTVALRRARSADGPEKNLLAAVAWVPVTLLLWEFVTILGRSVPAPGSSDAQFEAAVEKQAPQYAHPLGTVYRDHLLRVSQDGAHQGFAIGAVLGAVLVLGQAVLLTRWAWRSRPERAWNHRVVALAVAVWFAVAALPWWSQAEGVGDASGVHTVHRHASVWTASTLATAALLLGICVSVGYLRSGNRTVLAVFAWAALALAAWPVIAAFRSSSGPTITIMTVGSVEPRAWIVRDQLHAINLTGLHESFGWGAWLGVLLLVAQAAYLTWRARPVGPEPA